MSEIIPAAVFGAIIPRGALGRLVAPISLEDPITELATYAEDTAEKAGIHETAELENARKEQLVLHHAVFYAGSLRQVIQVHGFIGADRKWASRSTHVFPPRSPHLTLAARRFVSVASK